MAPRMRGAWVQCAACWGERQWCFPRFCPVNPRTGRRHGQGYVNVRTGSVNQPWPSDGQWAYLCRRCRDVIKGNEYTNIETTKYRKYRK